MDNITPKTPTADPAGMDDLTVRLIAACRRDSLTWADRKAIGEAIGRVMDAPKHSPLPEAAPVAPTPPDARFITLPREMDEDLWYIVGGALGAQSPEQCERAEPLWNKLVQRADRDASKAAPVAPAPQPAALTGEQKEYLDQAQSMLEDYAEHLDRMGNNSTAKGAEASAHVIRGMLAAAPKASLQQGEYLPLAAEAKKLAPILKAMLEGGSVEDDVDIYANDYDAPDGDVFVYRAAQLLGKFSEFAARGAAQAAPDNRVPEAWTNLLAYALQDDMHNRLTPRVVDIAYTAFMQAKRPNDEDGGASDWFNDTKPKVAEMIARLRKDLIEELAPAPVAEDASLTQAARDVLAERQRQISSEHRTHVCDDINEEGEMARAAAAYAVADPMLWPALWNPEAFKPTTHRRNVIKAGALCLAEIERLDRASVREGGAKP